MPICVADSIQPGVTILPVASITRAPAGTCDVGADRGDLAGPDHDRSRSIAGPDTGNTRALVIATFRPPPPGAGAAAPRRLPRRRPRGLRPLSTP